MAEISKLYPGLTFSGWQEHDNRKSSAEMHDDRGGVVDMLVEPTPVAVWRWEVGNPAGDEVSGVAASRIRAMELAVNAAVRAFRGKASA